MRLGAPTGGQQAPQASKARSEDQWKKEAWHCYHAVGEIKFATRFRANSLARLRLFPAIRISDEDDPTSVTAAASLSGDGSDDSPVAPLTPQIAAAVNDEWQRLRHCPGGMADLQRSYGVHMTIPGESNLIGWDDNGQERWAMLPETCVKAGERAGLYTVKHPDTGVEFQIDASDNGPDFAARLWLRDESEPWKSDSNLRAALDIVEELLIYQRSLRATGKSRTPAGLLAIANEFDLEEVDPVIEEDDSDPDNVVVLNPDESTDGLTDFERGIIQSFIMPTEDDGSAASVAPHMIRGPQDAIDKGLKYLSMARTIDPEVIARIDHLIERLAHALDVPVEVITGMADASHWTAWFIEDTTYKAHIEPLAQTLGDDLARVFLRPALLARGIDPQLVEQIVLGIDPSGLVVRPNRYADALEAFKEFALSFDALRRYGNFQDSDAPDQQEIAARVEIAAGLHARAAVEAPPGAEAPTPTQPNPPAPGGEGGDDIAPKDNSGGGQGGGDPTPGTAPAARQAITAAGGTPTDIGQRLAAIDNRLAARLQTAASAALTAALARAGARLRGAVQGDPGLAAQVKGAANSDVGQIVGPGHVASGDLIGASDFEGLHQQWNDWTRQARDQALTAIETEGERRGLDPDAIDSAVAELRATQDQDIASGWSVLSSALIELGRGRVYTPDAAPDLGEFDPHMSVPMGVVRRALGTMGDGGLADAAGASLSSGPATGASMMRFGIAAALGASTVAYQWSWGGGSNPFPPHADLDGVVVSGMDDPALLYDDWPADGGYLAPNDHLGCQCSLDPIIVIGGAVAD